jgi:hypothetical protein
MPGDDEKDKGPVLQNSLGISPRHVADALGRSLREHYRDIVEEEVPDNLKPLVERFGKAKRRSMKTTGR